MQVGHASRKIRFVANQMLPIAALPDAPFFASALKSEATLGHWQRF